MFILCQIVIVNQSNLYNLQQIIDYKKVLQQKGRLSVLSSVKR
ncbi:MAG: hypothetical protein JWN28_502 [Candidatus Saccharibacteria bacterium]|nr:hypothetical protein [Candidatus Saccharibacteria bacterium]